MNQPFDAQDRDGDEHSRFKGLGIGDLTGPAKTTGSARYAGDLRFEGLLEAAVVRSPYPHAKILSIDLSQALAVPGVMAAVTSEDFGDVTYIGAGGPLSDRPPLAREVVRFVGEEVIALAATSAAALERAIPLVRIRYRPRVAVFTTEAALQTQAPRLHSASEAGNIARTAVFSRGHPTQAADAGEVSVRGTYFTGSQAHCCLEPHTVIASWPEESGPLDIWTPTQAPLNIRRELAHVLHIPEGQVRMREIAIGGDFGSKVKISTSEAIAAALARKTRRPVRLRLSREEEFAASKRRYPFEIELELHATQEGVLTQLSANAICEMGAYHAAGAGDFAYFPEALSSLYNIENVRVSSTGVYTNQTPPGSFRGAGAPQASFARESALDELASKLGLDPFEIRLRNLSRSEQAVGWKLDNERMAECLEVARQEIGWDRARAANGKRRGRGVAAAVHVTGVGPLNASAFVDADSLGRITVWSASADPGTGQKTILAQVAAHELGVSPDTIDVILGETSAAPYDPGLGASKGSYVSSNAVGAAARDLLEKLRLAAVAKHEVNEVSFSKGSAHTSRGSLTLAQLVSASPETRSGVLRGVGTFEGGRPPADSDPSDGYSYVAQAVEVEVDEDLGLVRVVRFVSVHDSGTILNPILARGQVEGGVMMGIGAALGEGFVREGGRVANCGFADYALPRSTDLPDLKIIFLKSNEGPGRYAARGIAEICLAPSAAAVANAIHNAIGVRIRSLPITPDKIVAASISHPTSARPIWTRPDRWWIETVRRLYPLGLKKVLDRRGTQWPGGRSRTPNAPSIVQPETLEDALRAMAHVSEPRAMGGGTDLMLVARQGLRNGGGTWVDLRASGRMASIGRAQSGELHLGGAATLNELIASEDVPLQSGLRETALTIASRQTRNVATIAGNLCQDKRCWFYRHGFNCYKRAGYFAPCYAIEGDHRFYHAVMGARRCQAVTPSDMATTLGALDAKVRICSAQHERTIALLDLYTGPGETNLNPSEIITDVIVPAESLTRFTGFEKLALSEGGFAVCSSAASVSIDAHGTFNEVRVVLGAMAPVPIRLTAVERALLGRPATHNSLALASAAWVKDAHPLKNNAWKLSAGRTLVQRSVEAAVNRALKLSSKAVNR